METKERDALLENILAFSTYDIPKEERDIISPHEDILNSLEGTSAYVDGLIVCYYHYENVKNLENSILKALLENHPGLGRPNNTFITQARRIGIECQAYILAERQLFEYLSWIVRKKKNITKPVDEKWGFSALKVWLKTSNEDNELKEILENFEKNNPEASNTAARRRIAHYHPLIASDLSVNIAGWGAATISYTATSEFFKMHPNLDADKWLSNLLGGSIDFANPIHPGIHRRFKACIGLLIQVCTHLSKT